MTRRASASASSAMMACSRFQSRLPPTRCTKIKLGIAADEAGYLGAFDTPSDAIHDVAEALKIHCGVGSLALMPPLELADL